MSLAVSLMRAALCRIALPLTLAVSPLLSRAAEGMAAPELKAEGSLRTAPPVPAAAADKAPEVLAERAAERLPEKSSDKPAERPGDPQSERNPPAERGANPDKTASPTGAERGSETATRPNAFSRLVNMFVSSRPQIVAEPVGPGEPLVVRELHADPQPLREVDLTRPSKDLWVRIRHGFAMPNLNDDLVLHYQLWYKNRPEALRRMVERSRPYLFHIVEEIEARGMPTELALLPMVESSFNPLAYSRAHASGLWQFIPATGKRFNLEQDWWQDQRRDVVASTSAALDYLQNIYEMNGDWHLALASYNWGENAVKRAVDKNTARGMPTDFVSLTMPPETRHYVPKLQALKNIFGNPVLMTRLNLPAIANQPYFSTVEVGKQLDIKTAARLANMPVQEFVALNPSHNRPVIKPDIPVVLPADKVETFQNNLETTREPLTSWQAYTLKPGEKLEKLAPRFGIKLGDLLRLNGIGPKGRQGNGATVLLPTGDAPADAATDLPVLAAPPPEPAAAAASATHAAPAAAAAKGKAAPATASAGKLGAKATPAKGKDAARAPSARSASEARKAPVREAGKPKDAGKSKEKTAVKDKPKDSKAASGKNGSRH